MPPGLAIKVWMLFRRVAEDNHYRADLDAVEWFQLSHFLAELAKPSIDGTEKVAPPQ